MRKAPAERDVSHLASIPLAHPNSALMRRIVLLTVLTLAACASPSDDGGGREPSLSLPVLGSDTTLDLATWNIEFFGSESGGPQDDALQRRNVRDVILAAEVDVWGVQEISDGQDFRTLLSELPGYTGLLADDPSVADGAAYYSDFGGTELKVGLIVRDGVVRLGGARIVLTELEHAFAGRPPLEVEMEVRAGGVWLPAVALVLHAKAGSDDDDWQRRRDAAEGLRGYLDRRWPDARVYVLGDFNDDVDVSIVPGHDTPYRVFVDSQGRWWFPTASLSAVGESSFLGRSDMIDHILVSDEASGEYVPASAGVVRLDDHIPSYGSTTSDHRPVTARFRPAPDPAARR